MCHTWGLARSPAELQGGQGQGHQGVPLQVKNHSLFSRFSFVISTCLAIAPEYVRSQYPISQKRSSLEGAQYIHREQTQKSNLQSKYCLKASEIFRDCS